MRRIRRIWRSWSGLFR